MRAKKKPSSATAGNQVSTHEAKTHLSRLLERVQGGEEIVIRKGERPVARLVAYEPPLAKRRLGRDASMIWISHDFDSPLPADVIEDFEG